MTLFYIYSFHGFIPIEKGAIDIEINNFTDSIAGRLAHSRCIVVKLFFWKLDVQVFGKLNILSYNINDVIGNGSLKINDLLCFECALLLSAR